MFKKIAGILPQGMAIKESFSQGYSISTAKSDMFAGITLGIVAMPLAMALAIASGAPPQYGLYTSIIAGALIAITGGSRFSVSGPTAAFVVILFPITQTYGLGGLLLATVMAGIILVIMGITKLGKLIQFIPAPVTLGFTTGIAVVIAILQLSDLFGISGASGDVFQQLEHLGTNISSTNWQDLFLGLLTFSILAIWPKLNIPIPSHLFALFFVTILALLLAHFFPENPAVLLGDKFSWTLDDGTSGTGIPPVLPEFVMPWNMPNADGTSIGLSWDLIQKLLPSAMAIAMLGAIESLLCAVVADGLGGSKHSPNTELIGQGLGNIVAPFFGGITATGALARTATNIRAGGKTPVASVIHSIVILLSILAFASFLSYLPMAALAGLLLMVAWNMSNAEQFFRIIKVAPLDDTLVLISCFSLTVLFDMVIAVGVGVVSASFLFMRNTAAVTDLRPMADSKRQSLNLPDKVAYYQVIGSLFFGAAEKALSRLGVLGDKNLDATVVLLLDMNQVNSLDITAIDTLDRTLRNLKHHEIRVVIIDLAPHLWLKLKRAKINKDYWLMQASNQESAIEKARHILSEIEAEAESDNL